MMSCKKKRRHHLEILTFRTYQGQLVVVVVELEIMAKIQDQ